MFTWFIKSIQIVTKTMAKLCCVCLELDEIMFSPSFTCGTCDSGYMCFDCINDIDPCGSIFEDCRKCVERVIKCPCCRSLNWKYHFSQIIRITLGMDLMDYDNERYPPALVLYVKNQAMAESE